MAQSGNGSGGGLNQLPYYREYIEQILRPRVGKIIEDVRSTLTEHVWAEVLQRVAREQGAPGDPASLEQIRAVLEQSLRLRMSAHIVADFDGNGYAAAQGSPAQVAHRGAEGELRENVEVIEAGFPNNPLARAVGGIRRANR